MPYKHQDGDLTPLADEKRSALPTPIAARHLGRRPQALRRWACYDCGPLRPLRVGGRLLWRVADLKKLLGESQ